MPLTIALDSVFKLIYRVSDITTMISFFVFVYVVGHATMIYVKSLRCLSRRVLTPSDSLYVFLFIFYRILPILRIRFLLITVLVNIIIKLTCNKYIFTIYTMSIPNIDITLRVTMFPWRSIIVFFGPVKATSKRKNKF